MSEICLFVSGKGGVGKSALSANLAVLLARKGRSVALIDADIGLRSQDLLLGMENSVVFAHIKVQINLHTSVVSMRRHCVPV